MAVAVSVAAGAEMVAEVEGGRAFVAVVVAESVAPVAVEEESTTDPRRQQRKRPQK